MYIIIDTKLPEPKIASTTLKLNAPTRPQLRPPTRTRIKAIMSKALFMIHLLMKYKRKSDLLRFLLRVLGKT